jgi:glycerol kinase
MTANYIMALDLGTTGNRAIILTGRLILLDRPTVS